MRYASYDDMAAANSAPPAPDLLEAFNGPSVVRWYNTIKFKLAEMIRKQEANRNEPYAKLLREYYKLWVENPITGSLNVETFQMLKTGKVTPDEERGYPVKGGGLGAADKLASMDWDLASYFQGLSSSLDVLIADAEVPAGEGEGEINAPMAGGAGSSMPPLSDFGPQEKEPLGLGGEEGEGEEGAPPETPAPGEEEKPPGKAPEAVKL